MTSAAYTWDNAMVEGRQRLALLEQALDATTLRWFDAIGVAEGWKCFELGAGGGSIVEALCSRVGPGGSVTALDMDARFLRSMPYENLNVHEANVVTADIPANEFDLVHTRWTLMHIPERDPVLERLIAALKPGGTLFVEEPDAFAIPVLDPQSSWASLCQRVFDIVERRGSSVTWGRTLPARMREVGLENVRARFDIPYFSGGSGMAEFWKKSWNVVRDAVAQTGADVSEWNRELADLDDPSKLFASAATISVAATKPAQ